MLVLPTPASPCRVKRGTGDAKCKRSEAQNVSCASWHSTLCVPPLQRTRTCISENYHLGFENFYFVAIARARHVCAQRRFASSVLLRGIADARQAEGVRCLGLPITRRSRRFLRSITFSSLSSMSVKVLPVAEAAIQARDQWSPYVDNGGYVD